VYIPNLTFQSRGAVLDGKNIPVNEP